MKCQVVLDKEGRIVSIGYLDKVEVEKYDFQAPRFGPELEPGQSVVELDVDKAYAELEPTVLMECLHADIKEKRPEVKIRKE